MKRSVAFVVVFAVAFVLLPVFVAVAQEINVGPGDSIPNNTQLPNGATVNVNGGTIGLGVELISGVLNVNDGNVAIGANSQGTGFNNINNTVNINGGNVGGFFQLRNGTVLNLNDGVVESFGVLSNSSANITGGQVVVFPDIVSGLVNIRGGDVASVRVFDGGTVHIFGTDFFIDGVLVDDLAIGETRIITDRNIELAANLEDGSFFDFVLNPQIVGLLPDAATFNSTVMVTRVEPLPVLGDLNGDGAVDLLDVQPFVEALSGSNPNDGADINQDGIVNLLDVQPFVALLSGA